MIVSIIVAVAENHVIGHNNDLIWHLPADMKYFKQKTEGHYVLMGRKNYESIPEKYRPLPNRENIVVSRKAMPSEGRLHYVDSIESGIEIARSNREEELFIIGGGEIYRQCMSLADKIYLTRVHESFEGDTYFPEIDKNLWRLENEEFRASDERNAYNMTFLTYSKK